MSSLIDALSSITCRAGSAALSTALGVPKRTMDRWISSLREGDMSSWSAEVLLRLCRYEAERWGSTTIADAFLFDQEGTAAASMRAAASEMAVIMGYIMDSHSTTNLLLREMATDIADGIIQDYEARQIIPLIDEAVERTARETSLLNELREALRRQLALGQGCNSIDLR